MSQGAFILANCTVRAHPDTMNSIIKYEFGESNLTIFNTISVRVRYEITSCNFIFDASLPVGQIVIEENDVKPDEKPDIEIHKYSNPFIIGKPWNADFEVGD